MSGLPKPEPELTPQEAEAHLLQLGWTPESAQFLSRRLAELRNRMGAKGFKSFFGKDQPDQEAE